jgi:hypothetical protein
MDLNQLTAKFSKFGTIEIQNLMLRDGWFMLESDFHPAPQQITAAREQK